MKRVKAACICQTLHFQLKDDVPCQYAEELADKEYAQYKEGMTRNGTQFRIVEEAKQPHGSIIVKIIKQYNNSPVGDYLN